jgi:predicted alpha/beta hydrolase family esterase
MQLQLFNINEVKDMTDIVIVHSKLGDATNHWYDWLRNNLQLEGYNVTLFDMADAYSKPLKAWVKAMDEQVSISKNDTYFITHGYGTLAALKYLELQEIDPIEGVFIISGFKEDATAIDDNLSVNNEKFDYENIKNKAQQFYGLCAKDDKYISYKETQRLMDILNGKCKVTSYGGHFIDEDGFSTFITLQENIQKIMAK